MPPCGRYEMIIYLDARPGGLGNDSNTGQGPSEPKATMSAALGSMGEGDTLLIHGGSRIHGALSGMPNYSHIGKYGHGENPIFDQSRAIPAGDWIAHDSHAGVWYVDVTHEQTTSNAGSGNAASCRFQMWFEWDDRPSKALAPVWSEADIAANVAAVADGEDLFTCHKLGSTIKDPRDDGEGDSYRYYVHLPGGMAPDAVYYAEQLQVMSLSNGASCSDLIIQRSAKKDMAGDNQEQAGTLQRINFVDVAGHAWVGGAQHMIDVTAMALPIAGDRLESGGGIHLFSGSPAGASRLIRCHVEGFNNNYYAHSHEEGDSNEYVHMQDCSSANALNVAIQLHEDMQKGIVVDGFKSRNDPNLGGFTNGTILRRIDWVGSRDQADTCISYYGETDGVIKMIDSRLEFRHPGGTLFRNMQAYKDADSEHHCTLELDGIVKRGGRGTSGIYKNQHHMIARDSVLDEIGNPDVPEDECWQTLTAKRCALQWSQHTLTEIQALQPDVANDCVVPFVEQPYAKTLTAGDLNYVVLPGRSVATTTGLATVTASWQDFAEVGQEIQIVGAGDGGTDLTTRITAVHSTHSGGTFDVDPVPGASVSGAAVSRAVFRHRVFKTGLTVMTFSDDGTLGELSSTDGICAGMTVHLGPVSDRAQDLGPRKIVALAGNIATLDRPVDWLRLAEGLTYAPLGDDAGVPRPSAPVRFGFPLRSITYMPNLGGPNYRIVYSSPAGEPDKVGAESPNSGFARFSNLYKNLDVNGENLSYGHIRHQAGYLDCGFNPIGSGDELTISAVGYVREYAPEWAGASGTVLKEDSYIAALGLGPRT